MKTTQMIQNKVAEMTEEQVRKLLEQIILSIDDGIELEMTSSEILECVHGHLADNDIKL